MRKQLHIGYGVALLLLAGLWLKERSIRHQLERVDVGSDTVLVVPASPRAEVPAPIKATAEKLGGKVVASVKIKVPARDTVIVYKEIPTDLAPDSTRRASFRDSTFAGTVEGLIVAPPCCAPLELTYRIHRPEFEPSVGFVRTGSRVSAVVAWRGERVEVETPFAEKPKGEKLLQPWVEGTYGLDGSAAVSLGVSTRPIAKFRLTTYFQQRVANDPNARLNVGLRYQF